MVWDKNCSLNHFAQIFDFISHSVVILNINLEVDQCQAYIVCLDTNILQPMGI